MFASLLGIAIAALGLLVVVLGFAIYFNRRNRQRYPLITLLGGLLGVMILLLTVLYALLR